MRSNLNAALKLSLFGLIFDSLISNNVLPLAAQATTSTVITTTTSSSSGVTTTSGTTTTTNVTSLSPNVSSEATTTKSVGQSGSLTS